MTSRIHLIRVLEPPDTHSPRRRPDRAPGRGLRMGLFSGLAPPPWHRRPRGWPDNTAPRRGTRWGRDCRRRGSSRWKATGRPDSATQPSRPCDGGRFGDLRRLLVGCHQPVGNKQVRDEVNSLTSTVTSKSDLRISRQGGRRGSPWSLLSGLPVAARPSNL